MVHVCHLFVDTWARPIFGLTANLKKIDHQEILTDKLASLLSVLFALLGMTVAQHHYLTQLTALEN